MLFLSNMTIKHKMIAIVMLTCIVTLLLVGTASILYEHTTIRSDMLQNLSVHAEVAADNCKAALAFADTKDAEETLNALRAKSSIVFGCVYDKNGQPFASYHRNAAEKPDILKQIKEDGYIFSDRFLTVFKPVVLDDEKVGTICLRSDLSPMYDALRRSARNTIAIMLLASLAAYLISAKLQGIISGPILGLAEVAKEVSEKRDYSARAVKQSNDEIGLLIDAFNEMLEQIQRRDLELVGAKDELEARVQQRTSELTSSNEQLTAEIVERKKAEQRQAELLKELENANQELKDFAYITSHDLKAPLRAIKTLAEWINTNYADKLDDDGKEQLRLLGSRVDRMHNLIEGILQYSRVGRAKEKFVDVDLDKLVPEIIDMVCPPENITVTIENELPVVKCEETRIQQVFQNLLSNAVKYIDKPEGIIKISCIRDGEFWRFSVADNGPGIEEKYFERIFKIFQTLSARDEFESTGVGLTVIKKIVELYSGRVWLESEVGKGTTFFFTLPAAGAKDYASEDNKVPVAAKAEQTGPEDRSSS